MNINKIFWLKTKEEARKIKAKRDSAISELAKQKEERRQRIKAIRQEHELTGILADPFTE